MKKILTSLFLLFVLVNIAKTNPSSFTIHVIGDSTVSTYNQSVYPQTGWGQVIASFFHSDRAQINNVAIGGRSSKTFFTDGRLNSLKSQVKAGDYLFIQFGHNDRYFGTNARQVPLDSFSYFLEIYLDSAKSWNAIPVLISPMVMNAWKNDQMRNVFTEEGSDYRGVMENLAKKRDVAFLDLNTKSYEDLKSWGFSYISSFIYHSYEPEDYPNWPQGSNDGTHFQENGSVSNSRWIAEEIASLSSATHLSNEAKSSLLPLINALKPLHLVEVKTNKNISGILSKTALFPAGAPLTLRVKAAEGDNFEYWADENCKEVSRSKIYYGIKAPDKATTYTAIFKGGSTCVEATPPPSSSSESITSSSSVVQNPIEILSWVDMANPDSGSGSTDTNHEGFTGDGFWNIDDFWGSQAFYQLESKNASTNAVLAIRYANGTPDARNMKLSLDGWTYLLSFPPTLSWDTWDTLFVEGVWIDAVTMPLVLESESEQGGPNIDAIGFSVFGLTRPSLSTSVVKNSKNQTPMNPVMSIFVFDAQGVCVLQQKNSSLEEDRLLSVLASGTYFIKGVQNGQVLLEQKLRVKSARD